MISAKDIDLLRSIAKAGSDYDAVKRLVNGMQWEINGDEVGVGLTAYIRDASGERYRLIIGCQDPYHPPYFLLTFTVLPEFEEDLPEFNAVFQTAVEMLTRCFGPATVSGTRQFSFRSWPYAYHRWSLPEGEFTLVQDEFDIQDGMDVTLWKHPVGTPLEEIIHE